MSMCVVVGMGHGWTEESWRSCRSFSGLVRILDFSLNKIRNLLKSFRQGGWDDQFLFLFLFLSPSVCFPVNLALTLISMAAKNRSHSSFYDCPPFRQPREKEALRPEQMWPGFQGRLCMVTMRMPSTPGALLSPQWILIQSTDPHTVQSGWV